MIQGPLRRPPPGPRATARRCRRRAARRRPKLLVRGDWTRIGGAEAMRTLMRLPQRPDAVFCANDLMALGAIDVLHELGLDVPGDVAVMGFDDVDAATIVHPPLTTVRNPSYEAGARAGDLLMSRMLGRLRGRGPAHRRAALPSVVRGSSATPGH